MLPDDKSKFTFERLINTVKAMKTALSNTPPRFFYTDWATKPTLFEKSCGAPGKETGFAATQNKPDAFACTGVGSHNFEAWTAICPITVGAMKNLVLPGSPSFPAQPDFCVDLDSEDEFNVQQLIQDSKWDFNLQYGGRGKPRSSFGRDIIDI